MRRSATALFSLGLCLVAWTAAAVGQDFRIDTEIFVDEEKEPIAENLTIFRSGYVYDFLLGTNEEITIFDVQRGRFTLLDTGRQLKTVISTQEVLDCCLALNGLALNSKEPLFAFAAKPNFTVHEADIEQNGQTLTEVTLSGDPLIYSAKSKKPQQPQSVAAFRHFADWISRLNSLRPGNLPPEARMELNKELAERGLLPTEIKRTVTPSNPLKRKLEHRSRHLVNWTLSGSDLKRLERAGDYLQTFQTVSFEQYCAPQQPGPEKQTRK